MTGRDIFAVPKLVARLLILAASLGGCGQRGPLVLPASDAAPVAAEAGSDNESEDGSEEEDGETTSE